MSTFQRITQGKQPLYTPKLRAKYLTLATPFFANDKDTKGQYSVTLTGDAGEMSEFFERMEPVHEELLARLYEVEGKRIKRAEQWHPFREEEDEEGNPTGSTLVKLSHKARWKSEQKGTSGEIKPRVFDSLGQPVTDNDVIGRIGRDSILRVSFDARAYIAQGRCGVVYDMRAVQVITPVWYDGANSAAKDFADMKEDGYAVSENSDF